MKLDERIIGIIKTMAEERRLEELEYVHQFVGREIAKIKSQDTTGNPHAASHDEGAEA